MDKGHIGLVSACVVAAIVAAHALVASRAWERRVHAAEVVVDSLEHVAADTEVVAAHTDTVRVTLTKLIQQTDSTSHPDSTCTRSLAARDTGGSAGSVLAGERDREVAGVKHLLPLRRPRLTTR